jgi:biotin carboxyl carrier protein
VQQPSAASHGATPLAVGETADALLAYAGLSARELGELLALVGGSDVVELELSFGPSHLSLRRTPTAPAEQRPLGPAADGEPQTLAVASPLVGIFQPAVRAGEQVSHGQAIGAIESLGMPTTVDAPRAGTVEAVLVAGGSPVEYGQPLLVLRPLGP